MGLTLSFPSDHGIHTMKTQHKHSTCQKHQQVNVQFGLTLDFIKIIETALGYQGDVSAAPVSQIQLPRTAFVYSSTPTELSKSRF